MLAPFDRSSGATQYVTPAPIMRIRRSQSLKTGRAGSKPPIRSNAERWMTRLLPVMPKFLSNTQPWIASRGGRTMGWMLPSCLIRQRPETTASAPVRSSSAMARARYSGRQTSSSSRKATNSARLAAAPALREPDAPGWVRFRMRRMGISVRIAVTCTTAAVGRSSRSSTTITSAGGSDCCKTLSSERDKWPGRPWVGMIHAAFESNRCSFNVKSNPRVRMLQAGPDDNRTPHLINSSRPAEMNSATYSCAAMYSCDYSVS